MAKILVLFFMAFSGFAEVDKDKLDEAMIDEEISSAETEASEAEIVHKAVEKAKELEGKPTEPPSEIELEIAKLRTEVEEYRRQKQISDKKIQDLEKKRSPASEKIKKQK